MTLECKEYVNNIREAIDQKITKKWSLVFFCSRAIVQYLSKGVSYKMFVD